MKDRKKDHIQLALEHQIDQKMPGLYYEPLLSAHPNESTKISIEFIGQKMLAPLWISSMTGGTEKAKTINTNLAKVAKKYGLGMGLGSCRPLLDSSERFKDFDLKHIIGDYPFYANLGIAQVEQLIEQGQVNKIKNLVDQLQVDGLIVHINPLQEWVQPEGDQINRPPIETLKRLIDLVPINIIVKEVGQGFGPNSLISLMKLPIAAIEFAAHGGTNFTSIELARHNALSSGKREALKSLSYIGHDPQQMIDWVNSFVDSTQCQCQSFIISGGIKDIIKGHYYKEQLKGKGIIGMGSAFLEYAQDYSQLDEFVKTQVEMLKLAKCYLRGQ